VRSGERLVTVVDLLTNDGLVFFVATDRFVGEACCLLLVAVAVDFLASAVDSFTFIIQYNQRAMFIRKIQLLRIMFGKRYWLVICIHRFYCHGGLSTLGVDYV
jgi:hypothetical protein